ncbi:MAG TPA: hypothetical protein VHV83_17835, partial [Armatimonadota bacterium]|nr:hypothetical protein [Armatimonadota bacterium]
MFNTFSAISTYNDDDEDSWRFPWRAIGITIALLAAIVYGVICTRNALGQFDVQRRADYLALTGPVAETIEQHLADDPSGDQQFYTDMLPQLFSAEDKLAAVRVWDSAGQLAGELTRLDSQTLRAGGGGTLPDLNFHRVAKSLVPTLHDDAWTDPIAQLQLVETEQDLFTKHLEALRDTHVSVSAREKLYMQQDNLLQMADELNGNLHSMDEEIKEMNAVLDLLTLEDSDAIAKAAKQSNAIQNALT